MDFKQLFFVAITGLNDLLPVLFLIIDNSFIFEHITLNPFIPLFQVLPELLFDLFIELLLLDLQSIIFDGIHEFEIGKRVLFSKMGIDIQLETPDIVHIFMTNTGFLHLIVEYFILEHLKHLMPHIQIDIQFLYFG